MSRFARITSTLPLLLSAAFAAGCEGFAASLKRPPSVDTRDSAGMTIVENRRVDQRYLQIWTVQPEPVATIPVREPAQSGEFAISGVRELENGSVVVLIGTFQRAMEFHMYDRAGKQLGRYVPPPASDSSWAAQFFTAAGGDTVLAVDHRNRRLLRFTASGAHVSSDSIDARRISRIVRGDEAGAMQDLVPLRPPRYFATLASRTTRSDSGKEERSFSLQIVDLEEERSIGLPEHVIEPLKQVDLSNGPAFLRTRVSPPHAIYGVDRTSGRICSGMSDAAQITCVDAQNRRVVIRWVPDTIPYTDEDRKRSANLQKEQLGTVSDYSAADVEKILALSQYPARLHFFDDIEFDVDGNIWILENALAEKGVRTSRFRIFNVSGEQIALANAFAYGWSDVAGTMAHFGRDEILRPYRTDSSTLAIARFRISRSGVR